MKITYLLMFVLIVFFSLFLNGAEKIDKEKILATDKEWQNNYNNYTPDSQIMDQIKSKIGENLKIDVYLGLWCSDSQANVPPFIKILDGLDQGKITVNYYTVERKANKDVKYFAEEAKVERVPTFIFYRDGKEIGRIVENPRKSLAEDFLEIVF
ncbi:MAG: thioredoxin family protein [Candidatus Omnitrophota bacterium]